MQINIKRRSTRFITLLSAATLALSGSTVALSPMAASATVLKAAVNPSVAPMGSKSLNVGDYQKGRYIVVMTGKPTVTYNGTVPGLAATKPQTGQKFNANTAAAQRYDSFLKAAQTDTAQETGAVVQKSFTVGLNGFVADLDAQQAVKLAADPKVLTVAPDREFAPADTSIETLGLSGANGVWNSQFKGTNNAGKGTVVGVIDTGYWPASPYFKGDKVRPLAANASPVVGVPYLKAPGEIAMLKADGSTFDGKCQAGQSFTADTCNSKVISARYFSDTFLQSVPADKRAKQELISPVDVASHGTHTASTSAGNRIPSAVTNGVDRGPSSGVAPGARLAIYKVCWEDNDPETGGCYSSSAVEAINQAIVDGVDVLNYSISGDPNTTTDPVSLAFLSAVSAGIFVAAAGGNSGPTASTVVHGAPWMTTVAASTWTNQFENTLVLSNGTKLRGVSQTGGLANPTSLILAKDAVKAGAPGVTTANAGLCLAGSLDPIKAKGKIVVCDRGINDRIAKSAEAKRAGAVAMVLVNLIEGSLDADLHTIPTVHVAVPEGIKLKAALKANPALTATIDQGDTTGATPEPLPQITGFSSRGPLIATQGDLLKPDISAPGVNVLAGVSPIGDNGNLFALMSGTSMATPHIAGLGALLLSKNPTWTPSMVKSAMMTTAAPTKAEDGTNSTDRFAMGAGQVQPTSMFAPGLVVEANEQDYLNFIQGQGFDLGIDGVTPVAARDVNVPSIALGSLTGTVTVKRTFTALEAGLFKATVSGVPGVTAKVTPSIITFNSPGEQRVVSVTFTRTTAPLGQYQFGELSLAGNGKKVNLGIAVQPVSVVAPDALDLGTVAPTASSKFSITSGNAGPTKVNVLGLALTDTQTITRVPVSPDNTGVKTIKIPANTKFVRFVVDAADPNADWDLSVTGPQGDFQAETSAASESLLVANPAAGDWKITATLYASPNNAKSTASFGAAVIAGDHKNLTVTPNPITLPNGHSGTLGLKWSSLPVGSYVGMIGYEGSPYSTLVSMRVASQGVATPLPASPPATDTSDSSVQKEMPGSTGTELATLKQGQVFKTPSLNELAN